PSANLTWALNDMTNLRVAASQTVSRPDLTELSSSPTLEYVAGYQVLGNPDLKRALIRNYDFRAEVFPGLSELFAAGFFYKDLAHPIEQVITGGSPHVLIPRNSAGGRNYGFELEARTGLDRLWRRLKGISVNTNATVISSKIKISNGIVSSAFTNEHP